MWKTASEYAIVFGLPGTWISLDVTNFDFFCDTGEVSWLPNPMGMYFDEMELTYTGGFTTIPDPVKFACAQLVRNAQAMPANLCSRRHIERHALRLLCRQSPRCHCPGTACTARFP